MYLSIFYQLYIDILLISMYNDFVRLNFINQIKLNTVHLKSQFSLRPVMNKTSKKGNGMREKHNIIDF